MRKIQKCKTKPKFPKTDKNFVAFSRKIRSAALKGRYLYHVTPSRNVKKILRDGLMPKKYDHRAIGTHPPVVFISSKWRSIMEMAKEDYCVFRPGPWVLLKIDTYKLPKICLFHDVAVPDYHGWLWTKNKIPARAISVDALFRVKALC